MNNELIGAQLLDWYYVHCRSLPWRGEVDPYKIWVSEIILQQTRVNQGWDYYLRFVATFPTVSALASAPLDSVLVLWQGLGYYSRARNMHTAAQQVMELFGGNFPGTHQELLSLKGVGRYTAAAIASIAYNEPKAAVDGNVLRVITRLFGIFEDISEGKTIKRIEEIAQNLMGGHPPGTFNQSVMELGATICKPVTPLCDSCPIASHCYAFREEKQSILPIKMKRISIKERYFHFLYHINSEGVLIEQRDSEEIWKGLFQLPLIEVLADESFENILTARFSSIQEKQLVWKTTQKLTHQKLHICFWCINEELDLPNGKRVKFEKLTSFAFPKIVVEFFKMQGIIPA